MSNFAESSCALLIKMGKQVKCGGALQNAMLVSVANSMGIEIDKFGQYSSGPLDKQYLA